MRAVPVIFHPANRSVFSDNPVFHIIHVALAVADLLLDTVLYLIKIFRMNNSPETVSCQTLKFLPGFTAENPKHGFIVIDELLVCVRVINKKSAGHIVGYIFKNRECFFIYFNLHPLSILSLHPQSFVLLSSIIHQLHGHDNLFSPPARILYSASDSGTPPPYKKQ